jgi:catechol 2,3-dioxygenase-like lactoylglutathione lyase family enzyme
MTITGAHVLLYSSEAERLRDLFRDVLGWHHVDAGGGWLIFRLPPAEIAVHPADAPAHELAFMCDDLEATAAELRDRGIEVKGDPHDAGWGIHVTLVLPGGVEVMVYEPRHATAI